MREAFNTDSKNHSNTLKIVEKSEKCRTFDTETERGGKASCFDRQQDLTELGDSALPTEFTAFYRKLAVDPTSFLRSLLQIKCGLVRVVRVLPGWKAPRVKGDRGRLSMWMTLLTITFDSKSVLSRPGQTGVSPAVSLNRHHQKICRSFRRQTSLCLTREMPR